MTSVRRLLWWGRGDRLYSRNGILRELLRRDGWQIDDFAPLACALGDLEATLRRLPAPDAVWVGCFRQRDVLAASRWARRHKLPLIFDPLISAWDKQVLEFAKLPEDSSAAQRLLQRERRLFASADIVLADTQEHAAFFEKQLGVDPKRLHVVFVGADERLFTPAPMRERGSGPLEVLFYGSMLPLQNPAIVVDAARLSADLPIHWTLLGKGPLLAECQAKAANLPNLRFESALPYDKLCERIHASDVLLGVFGTTPKAARVMPNKFFQSLAAGRPVITRASEAYPKNAKEDPAVTFIAPGDAQALADAVQRFLRDDELLSRATASARPLYNKEFSCDIIARQLHQALSSIL